MEIRRVLILISDYFSTMGKNYLCDIIIPFIIAIVSFFLMEKNLFNYDKGIIGDILTVLGIISGFGISSVALLLSSNNKSISEYKVNKTEYVVDGVEISYFRKLYILISYTTVVSFIGILIFFIGGLVIWDKFLIDMVINLVKALSVAYISHILIVNIRSLVSIYFLFVRETNM